jgi:hypothetical protein
MRWRLTARGHSPGLRWRLAHGCCGRRVLQAKAEPVKSDRPLDEERVQRPLGRYGNVPTIRWKHIVIVAGGTVWLTITPGVSPTPARGVDWAPATHPWSPTSPAPACYQSMWPESW